MLRTEFQISHSKLREQREFFKMFQFCKVQLKSIILTVIISHKNY